MTGNEREHTGKIFFSYLRKVRGNILLTFTVLGILGLIYFLYSLPVEPFAYGCVLSVAAAVVFGIIGFVRYWRRYRAMENMCNQIIVTSEELPAAEDDLELLYQEMINQLRRKYHRQESDAKEKYQDMLEYYTLWAHQIKTPIAAMRLLLQSEECAIAKPLSMEVFKTEQYVEMVLGYLRSDSMSSDLVIKQYSLDKILRQVIRKYAKMFILKKISLAYEDVDCTVLTDEKWLLFVLEQLISNALKYTQTGKVSIYMDPDEEKTLVIADTGIGIRSEDIPRVFEKGFTGYNGRQDKRSTGIGLYLSRKILNKLHHEIRIQSSAGEGTQVYINLASQRLDTII